MHFLKEGSVENKPLSADERALFARLRDNSKRRSITIFHFDAQILLSAEAYERERANRLQREIDNASKILKEAMNDIGK